MIYRSWLCVGLICCVVLGCRTVSHDDLPFEYAEYPPLERYDLQEGEDFHLVQPTDRLELTASASASHSTLVEVFFATDRKLDSSWNGYKKLRFNHMRSEQGKLTYGKARVSIPATHRTGELEKPFPWIEWVKGRDQKMHFVLMDAEKVDVLAMLARKKRGVLVYVHGIANSFQSSLFRAAQLKFDLAYPGPVVAYSWPATQSFLDYLVDEENSEWSVEHFAHFLKNLRGKVGQEKKIHIIAHSMGAKLVLEAIAGLVSQGVGVDNLVLAAPDIDARIFKEQLAGKLKAQVVRPVLYASDKDLALRVSKKLNRNVRAGMAGDNLSVVRGVETVDASKVVAVFNLLGHAYYASQPALLADIKRILSGDEQQEAKRRLVKRFSKGLEYFELY